MQLPNVSLSSTASRRGYPGLQIRPYRRSAPAKFLHHIVNIGQIENTDAHSVLVVLVDIQRKWAEGIRHTSNPGAKPVGTRLLTFDFYALV